MDDIYIQPAVGKYVFDTSNLEMISHNVKVHPGNPFFAKCQEDAQNITVLCGKVIRFHIVAMKVETISLIWQRGLTDTEPENALREGSGWRD